MVAVEGRALLLARLDEAEARLARLVAAPAHAGLSDPEPGGEERWDAGQVWAHLAEFPTYWLGEAERIIAAPEGEEARFGRATDAPERVDPIEERRHRPVAELWTACRSGIRRVRAFALVTGEEDWARWGDHVVRGRLTAGFVPEAFVGGHLIEHATQLERLERLAE